MKRLLIHYINIFVVKVKTYKPEEIRQATFDFFQGDELATKVWISKYALKDSFGNIFEKTPDDMHRRIAREIARIEKIQKSDDGRSIV